MFVGHNDGHGETLRVRIVADGAGGLSCYIGDEDRESDISDARLWDPVDMCWVGKWIPVEITP